MFVSFNKIFNKNENNKTKVPKTVLNHLNKSLPNDLKYITSDDGYCTIKSSTEENTISGFTLQLTDKQKEKLGNNFKFSDVIDYFYNMQKPIPLKLKREGYILYNGNEVKIDKLHYNPFNPIEYVENSFCILPNPFPAPFLITLGDDNYEKHILVHRVPIDEVKVSAFESDDKETLKIKYFVDYTKNTLDFKISYDLGKAKTIKDIIETTSIYNSFLNGNGMIFGEKLKTQKISEDIKRFDSNNLLFWKKVLAVEEKLKVRFHPNIDEINNDLINFVERIYQNLINHIPVKNYDVINSVDTKLVDNTEVHKSIGKPLFFEFEFNYEIELFGIKIVIPGLMNIFNSIISKYEKLDTKYRYILEDESDDRKRYSSSLCFASQEELTQFRNLNLNERVQPFHDAKYIHEFFE